jgi:hypothetical protein
MARNARIRIESKYAWDHHRGGWSSVVDHLYRTSHHDNGILFLSAIEERLWHDGAVLEPWVGVLHQVPVHEYEYPDLTRLLSSPQWQDSAGHCRGIFVLCNYVLGFLRPKLVGIPISVIPYPQDLDVPAFSWEIHQQVRRVVQIGEFLRNHQAFFDLQTHRYRKLLLANEEVQRQFHDERVVQNDSVQVWNRISDDQYDKLLSESVVFLNLRDAVAVTVVHECIARATPILVNRVGALEEFLGAEYPLFYNDPEVAQGFLHDDERLRAGHSYLAKLDRKALLSFEAFQRAVEASTVYRSLRSPALLQAGFPRYDVSVVICSCRQVSHIPVLLQALADQDFSGSFEILIWNNNPDGAGTIDAIVADAIAATRAGSLVVTVFHASQNFYSMPRVALSALARAPLMMLCDDAVLPRSSYLRHFVESFERLRRTYGERTAICTRGHQFQPHRLGGHIDDDVWGDEKVVQFFSETDPETDVHFMHADNLLIPTDLMRAVARVEMPDQEWALIGDYWMSFVLSHHLGVNCIKIQGDGAFEFAPGADNVESALFGNADVRSERMRFYIYHMRMNWPRFARSEPA